jgi:hypothetical protein
MTQGFHESDLITQAKANLARYQQIAADQYGISNTAQAFPMASRPDIAFRPACSQLSEVWLPGGMTAYTFEGQEIYRQQGQHNASSTESRLFLSGAGICVDGNQTTDIPLVQTEEILTLARVGANTPVAVPAQPPVEDPPPPTSSSLFSGVLAPVLVLVGLGAISTLAYRAMRKTSVKPAPQAQQPEITEENFELEL